MAVGVMVSPALNESLPLGGRDGPAGILPRFHPGV